MSQKNVKIKRNRAESYDEKKIRSSRHSKNKKNMADQLREEIDTLVMKQDKAEAEAWKSYQKHQKWKNQNNEVEAEFHWMSYRTWSDETHRLGRVIQLKLKAVQKYESYEKMEEPKFNINDKNKQQMKSGPSDEKK